MAAQRQSQINRELSAIFERHKHERVCVLGTICCGKTSLVKSFPGCEDIDDVLFPLLTDVEKEFIRRKPWTVEIGDEVDRLVKERVKIKAGRPLFGTVIVDCEAIVYLDIEDGLLLEHCRKRGVDFMDAANIKQSIQEDLADYNRNHKKINYTIMMEDIF